MKTMTSPPEVRTPADEADAAPSSETTRRRAAVRPARSAKSSVKSRETTTRPTRRRATAPAPVERRAAAPPKAPFVLVVVGLLGGALVSLLLLNTVLAQDAFSLSELQRNNQRLNERKQALQEDIARESSPEVLHAKARGLGMRDPDRPAFIDPRTGRVTESGSRPPGVPDEAMSAAAAGGVTGAPGALVPPAGGTTGGAGHTGGGTR
jgi:hypothetical protein